MRRRGLVQTQFDLQCDLETFLRSHGVSSKPHERRKSEVESSSSSSEVDSV